MNVSLNIILDRLHPLSYTLSGAVETGAVFRQAALLPKDLAEPRTDCLYICLLPDALRAARAHPEFRCICLRDGERDAAEAETPLRGIIVNEDIPLENLFSEVQDTFTLMNEWYEAMQHAIIMEKGIQGILTLSEPILGNFISISDPALSLLAYTMNISTDDPTSLFLIENGYHSAETLNRFKKLGRFDVWLSAKEDIIVSTDGRVSKYDTVSKVFAFNDTYFTHVVMSCNHRPLTPGLLDLFGHLAHVLSYYIRGNWEKEKGYDHAYHSLISDLMGRRVKSREAAVDRARFAGIKPQDKFLVMLVTERNTGISSFPDRLAQDITQMFPFIRAVNMNMHLMLFVHHVNVSQLFEEQEVEAGLARYFEQNDICCGISEVFDDLLLVGDGFLQAELALSVATGTYFGSPGARSEQQGSNGGGGRIAHYTTYFASFLLDKSAECLRMWQTSRFGKLLLDMRALDLEKKINNFDVLETYLRCGCRAADAAVLLHMHRNNVTYRISRIEELYGISLDDALTRQNLTISFLMHNTVHEARSARPEGT